MQIPGAKKLLGIDDESTTDNTAVANVMQTAKGFQAGAPGKRLRSTNANLQKAHEAKLAGAAITAERKEKKEGNLLLRLTGSLWYFPQLTHRGVCKPMGRVSSHSILLVNICTKAYTTNRIMEFDSASQSAQRSWLKWS